MRIAFATLLFLVACSADPGDVALLERTEVESRATVGSSLESATAALIEYGYKCVPTSGDFVTESGNPASAASFVECSRHPNKDSVCAITTQVILVPLGDNIKQVHFHAGNVCL